MASVPRSQPEELSQGRHGANASGGSNTAPMNELPVETIVVTNPGGMHGEDAMGDIKLTRHDEGHEA